MSNLGSSGTPVKGESFSLPDGHSFDNDGGDLVWKDSNGNVVARWDETNGEFVTDAINASTVSATNAVVAEQLGIPLYSDDANAPDDTFYYNDADDQTKYKNPTGSIAVTDALSQSEVEDIAIKFAVAL